MENNVLDIRKKEETPPLPLLQAFLVCVNKAMGTVSSNYTTTGAEAVIEFCGFRILMNLRVLGRVTPKTGFNCGVLGPMPDKDGA